MISNNEAEFMHILDATCLNIRSNRLDTDAEIDRVLDQIHEGEISLGLAYDLASRKMVRSEMAERLAARKEALLAA